MFQLQIFGIILFVQDSIFSLPFVSLLFLATRAENLVVKYRRKSRDKESPTKPKKVEHRAFSHSALPRTCNLGIKVATLLRTHNLIIRISDAEEAEH